MLQLCMHISLSLSLCVYYVQQANAGKCMCVCGAHFYTYTLTNIDIVSFNKLTEKIHCRNHLLLNVLCDILRPLLQFQCENDPHGIMYMLLLALHQSVQMYTRKGSEWEYGLAPLPLSMSNCCAAAAAAPSESVCLLSIARPICTTGHENSSQKQSKISCKNNVYNEKSFAYSDSAFLFHFLIHVLISFHLI